jgi:mono/diheme cytochrome c family protein
MSFEHRRALAGVLLGLAAAGRPVEAQRSVLAGAYTLAQARAGETVFRRVCVDCHATGQFQGAAFQQSWAGRSARDLFELIRTQMPQDNPGRLRRDEYAAVVAYIFELNAYPPGDTALGSDDEALRQVLIERKPPASPPSPPPPPPPPKP